MDLAVALIEAGHCDEGIHMLETMASDSSDSRVLARLSYGHRKAGNVERAIKTAEDFVRLFPRSAEAHEAHGLALFAAKRFQESAESFLAVLTISPDSIKAMLGRGAALSSLGAYRSAMEWFDRAAAQAPGCFDDDPELQDLVDRCRRATRA